MMLIDGAALWRLHAQDGFPLEMSLPELAARGAVPTWDALLRAAEADGANLSRLATRLHEVIGDAWPPDVAAEIRRRLTLLMETL